MYAKQYIAWIYIYIYNIVYLYIYNLTCLFIFKDPRYGDAVEAGCSEAETAPLSALGPGAASAPPTNSLRLPLLFSACGRKIAQVYSSVSFWGVG